MQVKPIPDGYHSITPYLAVQGAARLITFLEEAFDAKITERFDRPDGTVGHAEARIGDSVIMLCDAAGEWKPMPGAIYLYVKDADATHKQAVRAGGRATSEPTNQFYGDRLGGVADPTGNHWWIASRVEDLSPVELEKRAKEQKLR